MMLRDTETERETVKEERTHGVCNITDAEADAAEKTDTDGDIGSGFFGSEAVCLQLSCQRFVEADDVFLPLSFQRFVEADDVFQPLSCQRSVREVAVYHTLFHPFADAIMYAQATCREAKGNNGEGSCSGARCFTAPSVGGKKVIAQIKSC